MIKVIGICCSPRKGQTTATAMRASLDAVKERSSSVQTELIELAELDIHFASLVPTLADRQVAAMIIGTPVYFGSMTAQCKAFIDRCVMFRRNGWLFRNRIGAVLAVGGVRNGGQELAIQGVQAAMMCQDMICVSDGQPTAHFGATLFSGGSGGIEADDFGLQTARNLGRRVGELTNLFR